MGCASSSPAAVEDAAVEDLERNDKAVSSVTEDSTNGAIRQEKCEEGAQGDGGVNGATAVPPPARLTLKEILVATDSFSAQNLLGQGSLGLVYRGRLQDPALKGKGRHRDAAIDVAVKKLHQNIFQGYKNYLNEVLVLDKIRHPNLVRLVGYCHEKEETCLVYELCPKGSLGQVLAKGMEDGEGLPWNLRVSIAIEVAKGLQVMHEHNIIHRDLKANNILLTEGFAARVTDFALARAGPDGSERHVSTKVMGTLGYLDPAYMETGQLTQRSDVYAFGVILLELITGRPSSANGVPLVASLHRQLDQPKPNLMAHVDPVLGGNYSKTGILRMSMIAKACLKIDSDERPEINEVLRGLQKTGTGEGRMAR